MVTKSIKPLVHTPLERLLCRQLTGDGQLYASVSLGVISANINAYIKTQ